MTGHKRAYPKTELNFSSRMRHLALASLGSLLPILAPVAKAQDTEAAAPPFCVERPGQTTPPCVLSPGTLMVETGLADWTRDGSGSDRVDQISLGASTLRYGVAPRLELQLGWAGLVRSTAQDAQSLHRMRRTDTGDLTIGALYGLSGQDGPVAVQAFATLPTGTGTASAGTWSAGLRLPVAANLNADWQLGLTPEFDLAVNGSDHGHHAAYGGVIGVSRGLSKQLSMGVDVSFIEDEDPDGATAHSLASASLAWQANSSTQFDIGAGLGLTHSSPGVEIYIGFARRL